LCIFYKFNIFFFTSLPDTKGGDGNPPDNNYSPEDTQRYCVAGYDVFCISFSSLPDTEGGDGNPPGLTANFPEDTQRYCVAGYDVFCIISYPTMD
jgi:hypothetical protein